MDENTMRTPQPRARRPSQMRLSQPDGPDLPARLAHLRHLPWRTCYERQLHAENKSANTQKSYFYGLMALIETALPNEQTPPADLVEGLSVEAMAQRMEPMNGRLDVWAHSIAGLRPTTFNARLAAARHFVRWLGLTWPDHLQRVRTGKRLPRTLTKRELTAVLEAASCSEHPAMALLVTLMLDTGLRVSEVCALNMEDIDMEDGSARVFGGKGDKDRTVLFTARTLRSLEAWEPVRLSMVGEVTGPALLNQQGRPLQPRSVQRMMDTLALEAGLPKGKLTPHVLRHNFATGLLERGADLVTIQRLMGHATIATTRVYLEISDQTLREVYHRAQALRMDSDEPIAAVEPLTPSTSGAGLNAS